MDEKAFAQKLIQIGIVSYKEHETLFDIAKRCTKTTGFAMAGAGAVMGATVGTVTVPGIGTITGSAAMALAGLLSGTLSCTLINAGVRNELRKLANDF